MITTYGTCSAMEPPQTKHCGRSEVAITRLLCEKREKRDFSLNTTAHSRGLTSSFPLLAFRLAGSCRLRAIGPLRLGCGSSPPNAVQRQHHESHQRPPSPPLVTHLLQEPEHPVGPLDVIVGPHPSAHRVVQVG